jgi:hypothetical protein
MIVVTPKKKILGHLAKQFGAPKPGEIVLILFEARCEPLAAPIVELSHTVLLSEQDVMNELYLRGARPDKDDYILIASREAEFRELLSADGKVSVAAHWERQAVSVTVETVAISADLDAAEILFDLDEFTPS